MSRMDCFLVSSFVALSLLTAQPVAADLVTISDNTASGTTNRQNANDYIGALSGGTPPQIGGANISTPNVPAGQTFQTGDVAGRDVDATTGGRTWDYLLTLPIDAAPGSGFTNITFAGRIFENNTANLEASDGLSWQMFLNGNAIPVSSFSIFDDFAASAFNLANAGGPTVNQVLVRMSVAGAGFNENDEWFNTRGLLSATYEAVPEPRSVAALMILLVAGMKTARRKRRPGIR